jgi:hypothetical protein
MILTHEIIAAAPGVMTVYDPAALEVMTVHALLAVGYSPQKA